MATAGSAPHRRPGFNVIDDCSREALAIEIDTSLSAKRIIRTLNRIGESRGFPIAIRSDNGPEFTSGNFTIWCEEKGIETKFIQPGKPTQNGH
ncbi:DDE-type integrase/transposase/recombinase, partial [Dyadobacter sp. BHUBP1]|uniref:DDE-type integrase/transposase/recombinase n=1 Tax=Dyadobacter sp. BHUBP1 TaxID=3424178 RepID=UPI003D32EB5B